MFGLACTTGRYTIVPESVLVTEWWKHLGPKSWEILIYFRQGPTGMNASEIYTSDGSWQELWNEPTCKNRSADMKLTMTCWPSPQKAHHRTQTKACQQLRCGPNENNRRFGKLHCAASLGDRNASPSPSCRTQLENVKTIFFQWRGALQVWQWDFKNGGISVKPFGSRVDNFFLGGGDELVSARIKKNGGGILVKTWVRGSTLFLFFLGARTGFYKDIMLLRLCGTKC